MPAQQPNFNGARPYRASPTFFLPLRKMSKREIAAAAAKKYILSLDNATANPPADRYHSVITLITLGKAEEAENINREKFLQAILTEFFLEYPILVVPEAITDPQSVVVTVLDNVILTKLVGYHNSVPNIYAPYSEFRLNFDRKGDTNTAASTTMRGNIHDLRGPLSDPTPL